MNKIFSLILIMISISSCKGQEYEVNTIDLTKLSFNLNADKFYSKSMNRDNIKFSSEKQYVEKDTIREYDINWQSASDEVFGIQYNVKSYSPEDTVAVYENVNFSRLELMTTGSGSLMLLSATGECSGNDFKSVIMKITKKHQNPTIEEKKFSFFKTYHYSWKINNKIIELVSNSEINFDQTPLNIFTEKEKKEIIDIEEDKLKEIHLFICKADFEKKLRGKMNSGDWSDFK